MGPYSEKPSNDIEDEKLFYSQHAARKKLAWTKVRNASFSVSPLYVLCMTDLQTKMSEIFIHSQRKLEIPLQHTFNYEMINQFNRNRF